MGADLFIRSVYEANTKKYQKAFETLAQARDAIKETGDKKTECLALLNEATRLLKGKGADELLKAINEVSKDIAYKPAPIEGRSKEIFVKRTQTLVEVASNLCYSQGYFRDSYNGTSTMWAHGLSWWKDVTPLKAKRGKHAGKLTAKGIREFLKMLEGSKMKRITAAYLRKKHCVVDAKNTVESWKKMYVEGKAELIAFLKLALKLKQPIEASL